MKKTVCLILFISIIMGAFAIGSSASGELLNDHLVTHYDFEGESEEERLSDKAPAGKSQDTLGKSGEVEITDGVAHIHSTANEYLFANGSRAEGDMYDFKNKTLMFTAKIDGNGATSVTSFMEKDNVLRYTIANADALYQISLNYWVDGSSIASGNIDDAYAQSEYRTYAISFDTESKEGKAILKFYMSAVEEPKSASDFILLYTDEKDFTDADTTFSSDKHLYIGKRFSHISKDRKLETYFKDIRVYDKVLSSEELLNATNGSADSEYEAAKAPAQFVAVQTAVGESTYCVRFVGTVDSAEYSGVGYEIIADTGDAAYKFVKTGTEVYTKILASTQSGITEYTAEELNGKYLFALTVTDIPKTEETVTFTVRPFVVTSSGETVYGTEKSVTCDNAGGIKG